MKTIPFSVLAGVSCSLWCFVSCGEQAPSKPVTKSVMLPESGKEGLASVPIAPKTPTKTPGNGSSVSITPPSLGTPTQTSNIAPPPVTPDQATRLVELPNVTNGPPTAEDVAKMLPPGNWEIKEVRHGTVAPGEGPVGPDGKVVDLSKLNIPRGETPPASSTPKPKTMPLSPDQAPHLQQ